MRVVPAVGPAAQAEEVPRSATGGATSTGLSRTSREFRICHLSIQSNHIHLIAEVESREALSRGMQGFSISSARLLNAALGTDGAPRRGRVFADRYHAVALTSPTRVRNSLAYVRNNWRKHGEDADSAHRLDPYSSAVALAAWSRTPCLSIGPETKLVPVWFPQTWLLSKGWQRVGPISPWERPGAARPYDHLPGLARCPRPPPRERS